MAIPTFSVTVDPTNLQETVKSIVKEIRPNWCENHIVCEDISSGYINIIYKVSVKDQCDAFVLRIINTKIDSSFLNRYKEISVFLHETELSPKLLALLENGICQDYVHGETLFVEETERLYEVEVWKKVCEAMARFHSENILAKLIEIGEDKFNKVISEQNMEVSMLFDQLKANEALPADFRSKTPTTRDWNEAREWYLTYMKQINATRALCHMDVNASNVILQNDKAVLIDYDVTGINYIAADIAWYFLCHCNFREFNLNQYPSSEHQHIWLHDYLTYRHNVDGYIHKFTYPSNDEANESNNANIARFEDSVRNLQTEVDIGRLGAYLQATVAIAIIVLTMKQKYGTEALDINALVDCWEAFQKLREESKNRAKSGF